MENPSLHPQRESYHGYKGRTRNLSRFCGTKPVIFKPGLSWIDPKLGDLIPCLGPFNVLSWFEYQLSETSDLRDILSARFAVISEQSSFGR